MSLSIGRALVNREEFTPYGETSFGSFARKRYRFTGKERDEESGLSYHGARYYAPGLGRWTSSDPAGITGGLNTYTYVLGTPLCLNDPSGLEADNLELDPEERGFYRWPGPGETIDVLTPEEVTLVEYTSGANLPGGGNPRDPKNRNLYDPLLTEEQWRAKNKDVSHVYDFSIPTEPVDWQAAEFSEIAQAAAQAPTPAYVAYRRGMAAKLKSDITTVNTAAAVGKAAGVLAVAGAAAFGGGIAVGAESVSSGVSFAGTVKSCWGSCRGPGRALARTPGGYNRKTPSSTTRVA